MQPLAMGGFPSGPFREAEGRLVLAPTRFRGVFPTDRPALVVITRGIVGPALAVPMPLESANHRMVAYDLGREQL